MNNAQEECPQLLLVFIYYLEKKNIAFNKFLKVSCGQEKIKDHFSSTKSESQTTVPFRITRGAFNTTTVQVAPKTTK